jgi:hypothetical protein
MFCFATPLQVTVESIVNFVFTKEFQHPQTTGRLFAYGLYGPLDENNQLRSGARVSGVSVFCRYGAKDTCCMPHQATWFAG